MSKARKHRRSDRANYKQTSMSEYVTLPKRLRAPSNLVASGYISGISPAWMKP